MNKMIVANLVHRPIRSIISIFAVAVEVTLILMIVGLALGILDDNKSRQVGIGRGPHGAASGIIQPGCIRRRSGADAGGGHSAQAAARGGGLAGGACR